MQIKSESELTSIADALLEASGMSPIKDCSYHAICKQFFGGLCDKNNCYILKELDKTNPNQDLVYLLRMTDKSISSKPKKELPPQKCPRSFNSTYLTVSCNNTTCPNFSESMSYNCIGIHSRIYFPDCDTPDRVLEVATKLDIRYLNRYALVAVYWIRMYLLLFKYAIENNLINYKLIFYTRAIHNMLNTTESVETCSICGAYMGNKSCDCLTHVNIRNKRLEFSKRWYTMLRNKYYDKSIKDTDLYNLYVTSKFDTFHNTLIKSVLGCIESCGLYIWDIPLGFLCKSYQDLYGPIVWENFGLGEKRGKLMEKLFLPKL